MKTLDEIRREKAARIQAQQVLEAENRMSCDAEENCAKKPRLLRIKESASQSKTSIFDFVLTRRKYAELLAVPFTCCASSCIPIF